MKKPQKITVSLEIAKKMKDLGWKQSKTYLFTWDKNSDFKQSKKEFLGHKDLWLKHSIASPTAEEILRELPVDQEVNGEIHYLKIEMCDDKSGYMVRYGGHGELFCEERLSDALGKMWIYLKTKKIL